MSPRPVTKKKEQATPKVHAKALLDKTVDVPPRRTQAQRRADSERRLIAAAREVLARKGWVGMTLAEVGSVAGVSRGLASHHFGTKSGLLRALTLHINESFDEAMRVAPPPKPGLGAVIGYVNVYLGRPDPKWTTTRTLLILMAEALMENSENAKVLATYMTRMYQYLEQNIRLGIEAGEIHRELSPAIGAEMVIGLLRGVMLQRLVAGGKLDVTELREQVLWTIRRGFAA